MKSLPIAITALVLEAALWQLSQGNARLDTLGAIRLMMLACLVYLVSVAYVLWRKPLIPRVFILIGAICFRITLAPAEPQLSDDVYRYRWEGRVQAEGANPYLTTPEQHRPHDATLARTPTPAVRSGYGPPMSLTEWAGFAVARAIAGGGDVWRQGFWMKLPSVAAESATLAMLAAALPAPALLIYAWSPLPVIEFWWNGHNDALAVLFFVVVLLSMRRERAGWAQAALGIAIAFKWWPGVLWPLLAVRAPRRAWIAPVVVALSALPYWTPQWREYFLTARYMSGYVGGWRNNDSVYGLLLALTGDQYLAKYAAFALLGAVAAWVTWRRWPLERAALIVLFTTLLVSANCHPWYLTWFVPLLAFWPWPPVFVWQLLMPISYLVLVDWYRLGVWNGSRPDRWWVYVPVFLTIACMYRHHVTFHHQPRG